jgi:hypothetical protein
MVCSKTTVSLLGRGGRIAKRWPSLVQEQCEAGRYPSPQEKLQSLPVFTASSVGLSGLGHAWAVLSGFRFGAECWRHINIRTVCM